MEKLNGISVVIQADMWGVSQSLQRIQVTINVEDSQAILQSVYLNGSNAYACEDITEDFSSNIRVKDLYFKLGVIDGGNGGNINFIDENNDAILSFDFCQYEWSILDIFQDTYHKLNMRNDEVTSSGIGTEIEMAIGYDIEDDEIWTPFLSKYIDGNSDYRILIKDLIDTQCNLESEIEEDDFFDEDEDEYQELRKIAQDIITFYQSIIDKYFPRKQ